MRLKILGTVARMLGPGRGARYIARAADRAARKETTMPLVLLLPLIREVIRLINNLIESEPVELRQAKSIIVFKAARPLYIWLIPEHMRADVDALVAAIGTSPTLPALPTEVPE